MRNRQMVSSASEKCIIQLLGYSVEEAYCRLEFDFARVGSSRSDREELPADEGFHIRRGSFSYGKEETADVDSAGIVQLIEVLSWPVAFRVYSSDRNCLTEIIQNKASPYFLYDIVIFF